MKVEIITTGEEVLSGQITDTNASWLSQILGQHGLNVGWRSTVGDRMDDLVSVFRERSQYADAIIVNGGLGPTSDDMSAAAAAKALDEPLVENTEWMAILEQKFAAMNRELAPSNRKQAMLPASAEMLHNPIGTACGFVVKLNRAHLYFTPGVPGEMKKMMTEVILPHMEAKFAFAHVSRLKRLHSFGIAEARVGATLEPIPLPQGITLGYRAHLPTLEIKVMGLGKDAARLDADIAQVAEQIRQKMGEFLAFEDDHTLASRIQELMITKGYTLALAESCTGGMAASMLVEVPGSSAYFDRGFVTYTNTAKTEMLGVDAGLIEQHGAVSIEVAQAMAVGARQKAGTTHAVAVSGIAGPGGGTEEKPVGTVCFALACPEGVWSQTVYAPRWSRKAIRTISAAVVLDMLRRHLTGQSVFGNYDLIKRQDSRVQSPESSSL